MIKLNWTSGKNLGLSLIYIGVMGLVQVIFILIAQFAMNVGSIYAVIFMPLGAILATFYSIVIIFESQRTVSKFRSRKSTKRSRRSSPAKKSKIPFLAPLMESPLTKPVVIVITAFTLFFLASMGLAALGLDDKTALYLIGINGGSLGTLFVATYYETKMARKPRR